MEGKLDVQSLQNSLLSRLGKKNDGIIISALIGIDACAYDFSKAKTVAENYYQTTEDCYTICKSDPITFPTPNPGRYAIIVNLNDLACLGAVGYGILVTWLLPVSSNTKAVEKRQIELHSTAEEFGLSILGGHTEFTSAVTRPVISLSMIGFTPKNYLPSRTLEPGDKIYLLGNVGNEGTAILGNELLQKDGINPNLKEELESALHSFEKDLSIYEDALKINKQFKPKVMHDPTEGGLLGALFEMFVPQKLGARINSQSIPIAELTQRICSILDINPLRLISSGTLLICLTGDIDTKNLNLVHNITEIGIISSDKHLLLDDKEISPPEADQLIIGLKNLDKIKFS